MDQGIAIALIAAVGTIAAAFVAVFTWYLGVRAERRHHDVERKRRILDIVSALHAEIVAGLRGNDAQLTKENLEHALEDLRPFGTPDETDVIYDAAVEADISILPNEVIQPVVEYYRLAKQINLLLRDFRDPYFLEQKDDLRRKYIKGFLQKNELQKMWGNEAIARLAKFAGPFGIDLEKNEAYSKELHERARTEFESLLTPDE